MGQPPIDLNDNIAAFIHAQIGKELEKERAESREAVAKANEAATKAEAAATKAEAARVRVEAEEIGEADIVENPGPPPADFEDKMKDARKKDAEKVKIAYDKAREDAAAQKFIIDGSEG